MEIERRSVGMSDETSDETSETIDSVFSIVARGARACSMPTPGCPQTGLLRQKEIPPSVIKDTDTMLRISIPMRRSIIASTLGGTDFARYATPIMA